MMILTESAITPADLLRPSDLTRAQLDQILGLALQMKFRPQKWYKALRGQSLVYLYKQIAAPSFVSFAAAAYRLGMQPIMLAPDDRQPEDAPALANLGRLLASYASAVAVHGMPQQALEALAQAAAVPVINAHSDQQRPCQALADLLTLRERFGRLQGLRMAYLGPGGALASSLLEAGALAGMRVSMAMPAYAQPDRAIQRLAGRIALSQGGSVSITDEPCAAVADADAVYADAWAQEGATVPSERPADAPPSYQITPALLARTRPQSVVLHGAPTKADAQPDAEAPSAPTSLVWEQSANRLPVEQALIYLLISGKWEDRSEV